MSGLFFSPEDEARPGSADRGKNKPDTFSSLPPAILLMGPTCTGKTELAIRIAAELPCEIVSVDSAMVYRGMDIGTAKPEPEVLRVAPHRLIDILDPAERYSAGRFRRDALKAIAEIHQAGRVPLLVGGTMLYFRVLQAGLAELPDADPKLRSELDARARREGWAALHDELRRVDPGAAARIHPTDSQRIQRALEVFTLSGVPISQLQERTPPASLPCQALKIGLMPGGRQELHSRIEGRFNNMIDKGFVSEVEHLHRRGDLGPDKPSIRAVGYRQMWAYLDGQITESEATRRGIVATRQLAKRQLTWLRAEKALQRIDSTRVDLSAHTLQYLSVKLKAMC